jgi:ABC-type transport system involved in multi-copper enzyme maturation permease subunit
MRALLHADWLRFRRRKDLWIIGIGILILSGVTFLAAYRTDSTDPQWPTPAQIREEVMTFSDFSGMTPEEAAAQIDLMVADATAQYESAKEESERQQAFALQKYDLSQAVFTMLGSATAPIVALVLISTLVVGDEFRFGTIRTSLLAAGPRRRFLAARVISLFVMTVGLYLAVILLAALLALVLRLVGAEVTAPTTPVDLGSGIAWLGAVVLATMVIISLGLALTVLLRSGALPLLIVVIAALTELFVAALPIFAPNEFLSGVPQVFLLRNIRMLTGSLGMDTHAVALSDTGEMPYQAFVVPMVGIAAVIAAWGILFLVIADRRLRTMDVVE